MTGSITQKSYLESHQPTLSISQATYLEKNFKILLNTTKFKGILEALKAAKLIVLAEKHFPAYKKMHCRVLEMLGQLRIGVAIEDSSNKTYDLSKELPYLDSSNVSNIEVIGWDDPAVSKALEEVVEKYISAHLEAGKFEEKLFADISETATACLAEKNPLKREIYVQSLKMKISFYFETVESRHKLIYLATLNFQNGVIDLAALKEIGWQLRTPSLIQTALKLKELYEQGVILGGRLHFESDEDHPFPSYVTDFHEAIKDIPTLILFPLVENDKEISAEDLKHYESKIENKKYQELLKEREKRLFTLKFYLKMIDQYESILANKNP